MKQFLVTIKIKKHPIHDPHNKVTGQCPITPWGVDDSPKLCSDVTGEHHTLIREGESLEAIRETFGKHYHVTRIEEL